MADSKDTYYKEEKLTSGQKTKQFIWNSRTREFLGRTGGSWAKLCVFYLIFYTCLAAFWAIMLLIFYQTIDMREPKWKLDESRIGTNPGLGFRPRPPADKVESTLIWFTSSSDGDFKHWTEDLKKFLAPYKSPKDDSRGEAAASDSGCSSGQPPPEGKYCVFQYDKAAQGACNENDDFGYKQATPCILIKLNRIFGWTPKVLEGDKLKEAQKINSTITGDGHVYITCEGENDADKENIGELVYYPNNYINSIYFPFTNQPSYLSPFVFVHFASPAKGVLINVECKAWAGNIKHDRMEREGSVHFELLID